jgi:lactate racemase
MNIRLKYGKKQLMLTFPKEVSIPGYRNPKLSVDKERFTKDFLCHLPEDTMKYRHVAIVVSDKTRLCGYPEYLPWITEILIQQGAQKENICFYIAYGTHPRQTDEESIRSYGSVFHEYRFVHHQCDEESVFEMCGTTQRGTPVTIRKDILQSSLLITFGAISHHYFAAYGGGRKLLFPGLGARKAIYHNHGLFLDRITRSLSQGCQPGMLTGNPLAEDLKEIDSYMPPKVSVHAIMNDHGSVSRLLVGESYADFVEACKVHDAYYKCNSGDRYDLVLASCGGYPKDINFIQAHKAVHHAAAFVKDGGCLILFSECVDGVGSDYFLKYLETGSFEAAFDILEKKYEGNGGTALSMMLKTKRIHIHMLTSLSESVCSLLGVTKTTKKIAQTLISSENGSMAVIRNASILVFQSQS